VAYEIPFGLPPSCDTKSISMKPTLDVSWSAKVRTLIWFLRRMPGFVLFFFFKLDFLFSSLRRRSMLEEEMERSFSLTSHELTFISPKALSLGTSKFMHGERRFPQGQSMIIQIFFKTFSTSASYFPWASFLSFSRRPQACRFFLSRLLRKRFCLEEKAVVRRNHGCIR